MAVEFKSQEYGTGKQILLFPDHYVCKAHTFLKDDAAAVTENGRKIIKAGTIYPANTAEAKGVVLYDVDATDGDRSGALVLHGFIKSSAIPAVPSTEAKAALNQIAFI